MLLPVVGFVLVLSCTIFFNVLATDLKTYIVHVSSPEGQRRDIDEWYDSLLSRVASRSNKKPEMVFTYRHAITGFAAKMTADQTKAMESLAGVLSVRPEVVYQLQTTRSPYFMGLRQNSGLWKDSNYGKGVIIGVLDTGITPGHPSFGDKGVPAPPSWWNGTCEVAGCNNKVIGLRSFAGKSSPVDDEGHGTHTSSTAAGNLVEDANVFGLGNGTASGIAPLAHLAIYKVCNRYGCWEDGILAAMDAAIEDGVNVLSISLGRRGDLPVPFYNDTLAIATFTAVQKGIFVSCSAGNSGPNSSLLSNAAPWILTVGASTIDRRFRTSVLLGNKELLHGESLYQPKDSDHELRPLVYPVKDGEHSSSCGDGFLLDSVDVKGKVVLCDASSNSDNNIGMGYVVKNSGGAAMILANDIVGGESIDAEAHVILASYVGYNDGIEIKKYINSTSNSVATILCGGTVVGTRSDPEVALFSSRGPNLISPGILKPDIIGPGVDILAAYPVLVNNQTETTATFNVLKGTSMACPHLSGVAALLKSAHPEWSPAAIHSALMTTASQVNQNGDLIKDQRGLPADVFAIGSGHVNAPKAYEPGLVFDIQPKDYIAYLCGLGYTPEQIEMIVKKKANCSITIEEAQLNYPSFALSLRRGDSKNYTRTVTNVGLASSNYNIGDISVPNGIHVEVVVENDSELRFTEVHQARIYQVIFSRDIKDEERGAYGQGHMTWVSGKYTVRTPFSFKFE